MDMSMELTLRDIPAFLPPWTFAKVGRPDERRARQGARRGFVDLKMSFMRAAAEVQGSEGQALQEHVRQAAEPIELWLMQAQLLASLPQDHLRGDQHRQALQEALARVLPMKSA